jgi:hypothetical protein
MAHFAELDENNIVRRVIVISNQDTLDENGNESESVGIAFCQNLFGGIWKQTSYNSNFRKNYAGTGYTHRLDIDAYVSPQPFLSWVLNEAAQWEPPIPMPDDGNRYWWDESSLSWKKDEN